MPYSYPNVIINSQPYAVYGDSASAQLYLQANISSQATAWLAATAGTKDQSLVSAVRWLDAQKWLGVPTDLVTPQALQWPRTGVTDAYGQTVDENTVPVQIQFAEFELAAWLALNPDYRTELQNPTPAELQAGSVSIRYFRPVGAAYGAQDVQVTSVFPKNVMDLVGIWLAGGPGAAALSSVTGKGFTSKSPLDDYPGVIHGF